MFLQHARLYLNADSDDILSTIAGTPLDNPYVTQRIYPGMTMEDRIYLSYNAVVALLNSMAEDAGMSIEEYGAMIITNKSQKKTKFFK